MFKFSTIIFCLIIFLSACQPQRTDEPMLPEMAKSMLKLQGYFFDEKNFFRAIKENNVAAVKAFFDAGINPNSVNENKITALNVAIKESETKIVKAIIEKADINLKDNNGNSPLYLALKENKDDVVEALLAKNVDTNAVGRDGGTENQSILYLATIRNDEALVQKLLEKGANPNLADNAGATPLNEVCYASGNVNIAKMLIEKGADVKLKEKKGGTALIYIASNNNISASKRQEIVKLLLEKGADKSAKDISGKTALDWAKKQNHPEVVELLSK